jgi:hypothetical protein
VGRHVWKPSRADWTSLWAQRNIKDAQKEKEKERERLQMNGKLMGRVDGHGLFYGAHCGKDLLWMH